MGAYLSHPKTDKASTDEFNDLLIVGASSMQGWRNSQEDAHNSILSFDKNTSFFAVYDGHGGAEVAQYCADKLPEFLKSLEAYMKGDFEQALKDAFLGFDKTLLEPPVVTTLKILAGEHNIVEDGYEDDDDDEELAELHEESNLPLNEVLEKYKGLPPTHDLALLKDSSGAQLSSSSFRGRRAAAVAAEAVNKAVMDPTSKPSGSSTSAAAAAATAAALKETDGAGPSSSKSGKLEPEDESTVSSSSNSSISKSANSSSSSNTGKQSGATNEASAGSVTNVAVTELNGTVTSSEAKAAVDSGNDTATTSEDATVSGSSDVTETKPNGNVEKSVTKKVEPADISSTSKDSEKASKKVSAAQDEDSTDDDADYDENAVIEVQEVAAADSSSDEDMEGAEDSDDDEDDEDDDEDDNVSEEDDTDEDRLANDQFCANMVEEPGKDSGCTAVVCLLHGRDLYVANAGDSRCVISRNGKAIEMSLDHKPEDEEESNRIVKAGGRVTLDGRVNGGLNLSRALGDHAYKTNLELPAEAQMISALPDIKKLIITPEDEFMILACDGIWNYMSSEEVVAFVRLRLKDESKKLSQVCEELFDNCLAPNSLGDGTGCDNMTAVIVKFEPTLQKLKATIDPTKTEDALLAAAQQKKQDEDIAVDQTALKRCASPDAAADEADNAENNSKSKRLKIDSVDGKGKNSTEVISSSPSSVDEQKESVSLSEGNESASVVSST